jgi:hypothetical protein
VNGVIVAILALTTHASEGFMRPRYGYAMLPRRPSRIFRSRWSAVWWACGVLFFAVTTIGFGPDAQPGNNAQSADVLTDDSGATVSNEDLAVLKQYLNQ